MRGRIGRLAAFSQQAAGRIESSTSSPRIATTPPMRYTPMMHPEHPLLNDIHDVRHVRPEFGQISFRKLNYDWPHREFDTFAFT